MANESLGVVLNLNEKINEENVDKISANSEAYIQSVSKLAVNIGNFYNKIRNSSIATNIRVTTAANKALKEYTDNIKKAFSETFPLMSKSITKLSNTISKSFKKLWKDVWTDFVKAFNEKTGLATFEIGTSLFSNSEARNQQMKYGLSSGQNYALTQTMGMLNMNEEDLMWMNPAQKEKFNELMNKYSNFYDEMQSSGVMQTVQEAQLELKMLKQDLANKFLTWFASHKDTIIACIEGAMNVLTAIGDAIMSIIDLLSFGKKSSYGSALSAEELNNTTNSNYSNVNVNTSINQNNNIASQVDVSNMANAIGENVIKKTQQAIKTY